MRPAARTVRTSSSSFCSVPAFEPAARKISSRTSVPWTSLAPKWSATCAIGQRQRDPVRLDVRDVVEHQARDREHLQVGGARLEGEAAALEDRVLGMERERDEREEAARPVLLVAQPEEMLDPLLVGLDMAVEERAVRRHPEPVRGVVDVEPDVRVLLAGRDEPPHAVGEHLGAAARSARRALPPAARAAPPRARAPRASSCGGSRRPCST